MTQTAKLTASDGAAGDLFGWSAAISGDTLVIGAWRDAIGTNNQQGSAYVFVKPGEGWVNATQTAKLIASDGADGDMFGSSSTISGDTLVVGAWSDAIGTNNQQGSAYIFVKPIGGWVDSTPTAKLTASDGAAIACFGWSVALSGDTVVVGAFGDGIDGKKDQGSAYVFVKSSGGWTNMIETFKLTAVDGAAGDALGWSVGIAGDTLVAGAYTDSIGANSQQGSAYVFSSGPQLLLYLPLVRK